MDTNNTQAIYSRQMSLAEILCSEASLVIPDMQRDFTWGDARSRILALGVAKAFSTGADMSMPLGLIYGYSPASGFTHIIDGQQRLTTLYLLLGMLYRRTSMPELKRLLVSDLADGGRMEPRLLYQAKRQAMYFMRDLVAHFFLDRNGRLSQLEKSAWYCSEYDSDVSVQNFISAIRSIDQVLDSLAGIPPSSSNTHSRSQTVQPTVSGVEVIGDSVADKQKAFDFNAFTEFVANQLQFSYCNLGSRAYAEQMFVTLNTTGQPLTLSQRVRAFFLASPKADAATAEKFNEIEDYFWRHPLGYLDSIDSAAYTNSTDDAAINHFMLLVAKARTYEQDYTPEADGPADNPLLIISKLNFSHIYALFKAYARAADCVPSIATQSNDSIAECFTALPVMAFVRHFPTAKVNQIADFHRFLSNIMRYQRPAQADIPAAIAMARAMASPDLLSLLHLRHSSPRLLCAEERTKLQVLADNPENRSTLAKILRRGEEHPLLCGRMSAVLSWCHDARGEALATLLNNYVEDIYRIWGTDIESKESLDTLRRALLAIRHNAFPIARRGNTIFSLCWHAYDWQRLMLNAPGLVRQLIDRSRSLSLTEICTRFVDRNSPYYIFVKDKSLLSHCRKRQLLRPCQAFICFFDLAIGANRWFVDQREIKLSSAWCPIRPYGTRCIYADHRTLNLAIDLHFDPDQKRPFRIEILNRADVERRAELDLRVLAEALGHWQYNRRKNRYLSSYSTAADALAAIRRIESLTQTNSL